MLSIYFFSFLVKLSPIFENISCAQELRNIGVLIDSAMNGPSLELTKI